MKHDIYVVYLHVSKAHHRKYCQILFIVKENKGSKDKALRVIMLSSSDSL